jgi:hypothetical protein
MQKLQRIFFLPFLDRHPIYLRSEKTSIRNVPCCPITKLLARVRIFLRTPCSFLLIHPCSPRLNLPHLWMQVCPVVPSVDAWRLAPQLHSPVRASYLSPCRRQLLSALLALPLYLCVHSLYAVLLIRTRANHLRAKPVYCNISIIDQ